MIRFFSKDWVNEVEVKEGALPPGTFTGKAEEIVKILLKHSKDKNQAMRRLIFYMNRAGKNCPNRKELEKAKELLKNDN